MRHMRKRVGQAGFTIIEVMIVVTVIGVLAAIVLPTYRVNTVRAKVSEALLAFGPCKSAVSELYISGGDPPGAGNWGCENAGPVSAYVASITTSDEGIIRIELQGDPRINLFEITLAPLDETGTYPSGGNVPKTWRCGNTADLVQAGGTASYALDPKYLPNSCKGY
jgi:type IV pilus assembly protein PilA